MPETRNVAPDSLREEVIGRIRATRHAPRRLIRLEVPPALASLFGAATLDRLRPAAVLVPLMNRSEGLSVLLTRRSEALRTHAGQIAFPGGRSDPGDLDVIDTALREAEEEIGLERQHVEPLGFLDEYPTVTGYRVTPVVGLVDPSARVVPDGREVAEILEVPLSFLMDPASFRHTHLLRDDGIEVPIIEILYGPYRIWGATAGMLRNFYDKVRGGLP
jgi:8-oxo-dGTP pyrophosphatase MutT (NUDIX family)